MNSYQIKLMKIFCALNKLPPAKRADWCKEHNLTLATVIFEINKELHITF